MELNLPITKAQAQTTGTPKVGASEVLAKKQKQKQKKVLAYNLTNEFPFPVMIYSFIYSTLGILIWPSLSKAIGGTAMLLMAFALKKLMV